MYMLNQYKEYISGSITSHSCVVNDTMRMYVGHLFVSNCNYFLICGCGLFPQTSQMMPFESFQNSVLDYDIAILNGAIDHKAPAFLAFKQYYCLSWGSILSLLEHVEKLLKDYAIPLAIIKSRNLVELVSDFELDRRPSRDDILSMIKNRSTVKRLLNQPGRRYKGQDGTEMAATKIQATWRRYQARKAYIHFRQQQQASGVIAISWLLHTRMARVKKTLKESRRRHLENFYIRAKVCGAASCYGSTSFLNISCLTDCNKLFPFFSL